MPSPIQLITNLSQSIANPQNGDVLFFNVDNTLLFPDLNECQDNTEVIETESVAAIKTLRERGIKVIALTTQDQQKTLDQLKKAKIELDEVLCAPDGKMSKGTILKHYLINHSEAKRGFVFDNSLDQLTAISEMQNEMPVPIFLKHYCPLSYLPTIGQELSLPDTLEGFTEIKSLGGSTNSVFSIYNPDTQQTLVLKFGVHQEAGQLEILGNALYAALGVMVPPMRVYTQIPKNMAKAMGLNNEHGIFKVSEFIKEPKGLSNHDRTVLIKNAAQQHFLAHVLLGNIDIAKEDNFLVDEFRQAYCSDVGANFIFRARGELRKEDPSLASELESLRNVESNQTAYDWFDKLSQEELENQLQAIYTKLPTFEKIAWEISRELHIPSALRDKFLQCISDRLDALALHLEHKAQKYAKVDKKPSENGTAAGVLTYTLKNNQPYVLLSKRRGHEWWDNFGGKSITTDENLAATAAREVSEESSQQINYSQRELSISPFHDIVTGDKKNPYIYRMYLCEHVDIDFSQLKDWEHTQHRWVPLDTLLQAVNTAKLVRFEGKDTVTVSIDNQVIPLFPPLYEMLQQSAVIENLQRLDQQHLLKPSHTLSMASAPKQLQSAYRPFITPRQKQNELALNIQRKSLVLQALRKDEQINANINSDELSQSELHLKVALKDDYQPHNLAANVRLFVQKYYPEFQTNHEALIEQCISLIENEKNNMERIYFYHGCSSDVAFVYEVYKQLYSALQANKLWPVFRADNEYLRNFKNIAEFIAFYSDNHQQKINNNDKNYNDCAIAANVFLFGNYGVDTSSSIHYMIKNEVRRDVDVYILLRNVLQSFGLPEDEVSSLIDLSKYAKERGGVLYQIGMLKHDVTDKAYASGCVGVLNPLNQEHDLTTILQQLMTQSNLSNEEKDYIKGLQARIIMPPQLDLKVKAATLKPLNKELENNYEVALKRKIDEIVYYMLSHHNSSNIVSPQTPLTKIFPMLLNDNQIDCVPFSPKAVMLEAVKANQVDLIKKLLKNYPELLYAEFYLQENYFFSVGWRDKPKSLNLFEFMLENSNVQFDEILDLSQESSTKLFAMLMKSKKFEEVFKRISIGKRLLFAITYFDSIKHQSVGKIMNFLTDEQKLSFGNEVILREDSFYPNFYTVIECLPKHLLSIFLKSHEARIRDEEDVYCVLFELGENERVSFLKDHLHLIKNQSRVLGSIISFMPEDNRFEFALALQDKLTKCSLTEILVTLKSEHRLEYALANMHHLAECDHYGQEFIKTMHAIPEDQRVEFLTKYPYAFHWGVIDEMFRHMDKDIVLSLLLNHAHDSYSLVKTLLLLPENERSEYAVKHLSSCVVHEFDLSKILEFIDQGIRLNLARQYLKFIHTDLGLTSVMKLLQPIEAYRFANEVLNSLDEEKLKNVELEKVMKCLPGDLQQRFIDHQKKTTRWMGLFDKPFLNVKRLDVDVKNVNFFDYKQ